MPRLIGSRTNPARNVSSTAEAALSSLIGAPAPIEEAQPLTSSERLAAILQRARQITHPPVNPLQRDFHKFLVQECLTKDESRGGIVRLIPEWPYIKDIADALVECPLLLIAKSRRVLASWICCCFDVWVAAGGQDERWPVLMQSVENRQVVVASRKLLGPQGSSWFLRNRIKFIVDELEKNNIRQRWATFPTWNWVETEARASNGSLISAIASGADQIRGMSATLIHGEEASFWEEAGPSIEAMIPATLGGGHVLLVTTPQVSSYAARIYHGTLKKEESLYDRIPEYETAVEDNSGDYDEEDDDE